jgi:hypothetical protein
MISSLSTLSLSISRWRIAEKLATPYRGPLLPFAKFFSIPAIVLVACYWNESIAHSKEFKFINMNPIKHIPISDGNSKNSSLSNHSWGGLFLYRIGMERNDGLVLGCGKNNAPIEYLLPEICTLSNPNCCLHPSYDSWSLTIVCKLIPKLSPKLLSQSLSLNNGSDDFWFFDEQMRPFQDREGLFGDVGGFAGRIGGYFGVSQAFANEIVLPPEKTGLDRTNNDQSKGEDIDRVAKRPVQKSFGLLLIAVYVAIFSGFWVLRPRYRKSGGKCDTN